MRSILTIFKETHNSFDGQEDGEKVILLLRRYPFFIILRVSVLAVLFFAPIVVGVYFFNFLATRDIVELFLLVASLWCLLVWSGAFYALTMYTLDSWIVTDRRIVNTTQNGFFSRTVSELHLSRIQDVSVKTSGIIHTLLKFGDLHIQTAGVEERFVFMQIADPEKVKDQIVKLAALHPPHPHP